MSCFLTPDTDKNVFTHPPELSEKIRELVGHYPVDVQGFRSDNKAWLRDEIFAMSRTQFEVVRHLLATEPWDYFHFVDIGQDRIHHGFWKYHDPQHVLHEPDSPFRETVHDYYRHIDAEIGRVLELLSDDTIVLVVSDHGAQRLDGGFCVNEWLVREGLLVLKSYPKEVTPFAKLRRRLGEDQGLERGRLLRPRFHEREGQRAPRCDRSGRATSRFGIEIKAKFEATVDQAGQAPGNSGLQARGNLQERAKRRPRLDRAFRCSLLAVDRRSGLSDASTSSRTTPGRTTATMPSSGRSSWRLPTVPLHGEITGAHLLDIAPTLMDLGGYEIPASMQGRSLVAGRRFEESDDGDYTSDDETIVRERLSGLGYIG